MGIAQPTRYGNEWIDYSKTYCKIYVTADGFYHIPDSILERYLPNLSPADTSKLVMVHNGLPIPIYVHTLSFLARKISAMWTLCYIHSPAISHIPIIAYSAILLSTF